MKRFIRNLSYSLSGNILSMLTSTGILLFLPKIMGIEDYGYWQLYMFYLVYTGYLSFGTNEGAFIRYSGKDYSELPKELISFQYQFLLFINIAIGFIGFIALFFFQLNFTRLVTFWAVIISTILITPRYFLCNILQATHHFKENTLSVVVEKMSFLVLFGLLIILGKLSLLSLLVIDILSKVFSTAYIFNKLSDSIFLIVKFSKASYLEFKLNLILGIKIVISNLSGLLIIGIPRFFIEFYWGVVAFSKVSLVVSFANLVITLINSVGFVSLPSLVKVDENLLKKLYQPTTELLSLLLGVVLILYYPLAWFINYWLPNYQGAISYMVFIFPIILFESKMALLYNTYLKIFRREDFLMWINLFTVFLTLISCSLLLLLNNSMLLFFILPFIYSCRSFCVEYYIRKLVGSGFAFTIVLDFLISLIFMGINLCIRNEMAIVVYITFLVVVLGIVFKEVSKLFRLIKPV
ncbi:Polysaccharide biosynthesis protein [Streptococcus intermedius]|uniref:Polysaccharide biosynthesis protein n=2 Tax=Streptococcus intermedius TaxID=1338 RepID=A0A3R9JNQ0_STRIT|nr:polysaccharide biosynthesis protein [Streptococcus intermedius]RSJ17736.1 Polysaccharide biosynthesis protein [Streptococcus intermedius]RSJ19245.1 Polysaccharide biosynthesis protein [Streptococcus intermedius]